MKPRAARQRFLTSSGEASSLLAGRFPTRSGLWTLGPKGAGFMLIAIFLLLSKSSFQLLGRLFPIGRLVTVDMVVPT